MCSSEEAPWILAVKREREKRRGGVGFFLSFCFFWGGGYVQGREKSSKTLRAAARNVAEEGF